MSCGRCFFSILLALALPGCGTLANLNGKEYPLLSPPAEYEPRIYGGVRNDLRWLGDFATLGDVPEFFPGSLIFAADLPLSAAADTITLPLIFRQRRNRSFVPIHDSSVPVSP